MEQIIKFLTEKYQPLTLIVYGSYADGTYDKDSDFDCLIVTRRPSSRHDASIVHGVQLDAFIYAPEELEGNIDPYEFLQIENGSIITDTHGIAILLKEKVRAFLHRLPEKSRDEMLTALEWFEKMVRRTARKDAEGYFRWHWLLCDSLELYCDLTGQRYLGPKKTLSGMERRNPEGFALYYSALRELDEKPLSDWIGYLRKLADQRL